MNLSCHKYLCLFFFCFLANNAFAQKEEIYVFKNPSTGGTGKFYMGREIAQLMSFKGKDGLERDSRPNEENTALAISNLPVTNNSVVADDNYLDLVTQGLLWATGKLNDDGTAAQGYGPVKK